MIRIHFPFVDVDGFKLLYNVYIRPHLEFCVQAWLLYFKKDIDCMEKVQHRATTMLCGFWNLKYEERLIWSGRCEFISVSLLGQGFS